jgi:lycopene cyclase domain-containing protein
MTYWTLNAIFLAVVAAVALAAVLVRRAPRRRAAQWRSVGIAAVALLIVTAVFDNVMIAVGLIAYSQDLTSGSRLGVAPLEDFAYAVAAAVLLPSLWCLFERRAAQRA